MVVSVYFTNFIGAMKTFATGSNPEDDDDEDIGDALPKNQKQPVIKLGFVIGGLHSNITNEQVASIAVQPR